MLSAPSQFHSTGSFLHFFFPSLTAMVGYWATLSLNIPTSPATPKSQDSQLVGQAFGLPVAMTLYSFIGIACTSASEKIFGHPVWSPIELLGLFHQPVVAMLALVAVSGGYAQREHRRQCGLAVERFFQPGAAADQLSHRRLDHRLSGPGHDALEADEHLRQLHFRLAGGLFRVAGPGGRHHGGGLLPDPRHSQLDVVSLYHRGGPYEYSRGINPRAIVALVVGVFVALIGLVVPAVRFLYDYAWFVGFFLSAAIYYLLMRRYERSL